MTEELNNISHTVAGAVKDVVDKTVEMANSIKPIGENKKLRKIIIMNKKQILKKQLQILISIKTLIQIILLIM